MLAATGAEACLIGLAITTVIDFFLWSRKILMFGVSARRFRYPELCRVAKAQESV
jgi:hypothetical protein